MQAFNLREGCLKAVPLWLVLLPTNSLCYGIFERAVVVPELELLERRTAGKKLDPLVSK